MNCSGGRRARADGRRCAGCGRRVRSSREDSTIGGPWPASSSPARATLPRCRGTATTCAAARCTWVPTTSSPNPPDVREEAGLARAVVNPVPGVRIAPGGVCLGALFEEADWATVGAGAPDGTVCHRPPRRRGGRAALRHLRLAHGLVRAHRRRCSSPPPRSAPWSPSSAASSPARRRRPGCWPPAISARTAAGTSACGACRSPRDCASIAGPGRSRPPPRSWSYVPRALARGGASRASSVRPSSPSAPSSTSRARPRRSRSRGAATAARSWWASRKAGKPVTCVTWGLAASLADPRNDAAIARRLAQGFGMPHEYFHLDFTDEPVRDVFARFLRAGEGRIEDFSGYTDGFTGMGAARRRRAWPPSFAATAPAGGARTTPSTRPWRAASTCTARW